MAAAPAAAAGRLALTRTTQTLRPPQRTQLLLRRPPPASHLGAGRCYPSLLLHGQQRAGRGGDRRRLRHCLFLKRLPNGAGVSRAPALAHCTTRLTRSSSASTPTAPDFSGRSDVVGRLAPAPPPHHRAPAAHCLAPALRLDLPHPSPAPSRRRLALALPGCSNRESRETRGAKKRRFTPQ